MNKRYYLILGGFLGFLLILMTGLAVGKEMVTVLQNAFIGCVMGSFFAKILQCIIALHIEAVKNKPQKKTFLDENRQKGVL